MTEKQIIGMGAEATVYREGDKVIKERIPKGYRHEDLDKKIIKRRTKAETKIMKRASEIVPVPCPEETKEEGKIIMPYIDGDKLADSLDFYDFEEQEMIMFKIGQSIAKLHDRDIIHGDLTTSNMIYKDKKVYIIDFGLGFQNGKYEDKGVDIHLLKQALEAKHFRDWQTLFQEFEVGYRSVHPAEAQKVFERMKAIEKRGRYKH